MPKGAILTHANAVAALVAPKLMKVVESVPGDTLLSFLPLAHIYERENVNMALYGGARIGFYHGDVTGVTHLLDSAKSIPSLLTTFKNCNQLSSHLFPAFCLKSPLPFNLPPLMLQESGGNFHEPLLLQNMPV
jgi:long-chain acyl-CoA synthetase